MPPAESPFDIDMTDEQLLAAFARGDRAALGALARRHERALLGLCSGLLGGRQDLAMDIVQETWLRVIRFAASFNGSSSVKTWLYRITINQCRTMQTRVARDAKGRIGAHDSDSQSADATDGCHGLSRPAMASRANGDSISEALHDSEQMDGVREAVARLDINRRTLVLLCYHAGLTHAQAAEILGLPLGTLKSRLHATLNQLRDMLPQEVRV